MTTSHGGDWNVKYPYDSLGAFQNAYDNGADSVKGDFRVSKDNIGMVMHSSPIEVYESLNCWNKLVEEMTAEECGQCEMINKDYRFISVPDMLAWADGKVNVMYCVKDDKDIPRAISSLIEYNATHRAFLELHVGPYLTTVNANIPGWDEVYWVIEVSNTADIDTMLANSDAVLKPAFLFEFKDWEHWPNVQSDIDRVHARGIRTMAVSKDNPVTATVDNHVNLFHAGFEVAYTYNLGNAVQARVQVNSERGISPP